MKAAKQETENVDALEGLDTLANLAILGEGEGLPASSQATTKHPRHRPGCSCIVCIQPPSGKGPKHKQTCTCNVCQTVKRRFRTLMLRREKKQSQKEAETTRKKQQSPMPDKLLDDDPLPCTNAGNSSPNPKRVVSEGSDEDPNRVKSSTSPFKGQIDLNIQPEREEELSPGSDSGSLVRLIQDATEKYLRQPRVWSSGANSSSSVVTQTQSVGGTGGEKISGGGNLRFNYEDIDNGSVVFRRASANTQPVGGTGEKISGSGNLRFNYEDTDDGPVVFRRASANAQPVGGPGGEKISGSGNVRFNYEDSDDVPVVFSRASARTSATG